MKQNRVFKLLKHIDKEQRTDQDSTDNTVQCDQIESVSRHEPHSHLTSSDLQLLTIDGLFTTAALSLHSHMVFQSKLMSYHRDSANRPQLFSVDRLASDCDCDQSEALVDKSLDLKIGDLNIHIDISQAEPSDDHGDVIEQPIEDGNSTHEKIQPTIEPNQRSSQEGDAINFDLQ